MVTQKRLKEVLRYNPLTGVFTWIKRNGNPAGRADSHGYIRIRLDGKGYKAHRLAWLYINGKFPSEEIDHINHNKTDNSIANLRCVTRVGNSKNRPRQINNTSGVTGISWSKRYQKWLLQITHNGKKLHLGYTPDFDIAIAMRKAAERKYGYHENHGSKCLPYPTRATMHDGKLTCVYEEAAAIPREVLDKLDMAFGLNDCARIIPKFMQDLNDCAKLPKQKLVTHQVKGFTPTGEWLEGAPTGEWVDKTPNVILNVVVDSSKLTTLDSATRSAPKAQAEWCDMGSDVTDEGDDK